VFLTILMVIGKTWASMTPQTQRRGTIHFLEMRRILQRRTILLPYPDVTDTPAGVWIYQYVIKRYWYPATGKRTSPVSDDAHRAGLACRNGLQLGSLTRRC